MKQFNPFSEVSGRYGASKPCCTYIRANTRAAALDKVQRGED